MPRKSSKAVASESVVSASSSAPSRASFRPPYAIVVLIVTLIAAGALALKGAFNPGEPTKPANATEEAGVEVPKTPFATDDQTLVQRVSRHMLVNANETPTITEVQDAEMLRTQNPVFYKDAENGDRLFVWSDRVILYSPSRDIVLASLLMNAGSVAAATSTAPVVEVKEEAKIEVRNGTTTAGLGRLMAEKLKAAGLTVLPATDAKLKTYEKTVIIVADQTKDLPQTLRTLQEVTGAEVMALPAAEVATKGDYLVIVGADFAS